MQSETSDSRDDAGRDDGDDAARAADPPSDVRTDVIVMRIGEIFLKGRNRNQFFDKLVSGARRLVRDLPDVTVEPGYLRVMIHHPPARRDACLDRLSRLFGLSSMSPARGVPADIDALADAAIAEARAWDGPGDPAAATFKIEPRRRDKRFPLGSPEIARALGDRVAGATGRPVDVHRPDQVIHAEVDLDGKAFVYSRVVRGPGGLPVGTGGKVGLLLSGGIDSPVAGWSMMRRGCRVNAIYFHSFPYTGDKSKEKVLDLARILSAWQGRTSVHVVHFTDVQKRLREHGRADLAVLLYRRMMMRAASVLALRDGCGALATGESIGQVASQTIENLAVIEDAASLPVLRPLICNDKLEIEARARDIGTYDTSQLPYDDCCSLFVPKHPATRARVRHLVRAEEGLDVDAMAQELADGAERIMVSERE